MPDIFLAPVFPYICGILGLLVGSFANVAIYRIPREVPLGFLSHRRSRCPDCSHKISWYQNVPLFSYLLLKGKCAQCRAPISWRYPLVEVLCAALFATAGYCFGQYDPSLNLSGDGLRIWGFFILQLYFLFALLVTTFIDIDFRIIPDRFSWGGWILALLALFVFADPGFWNGLLGGLLGFGMFYLMAWGYERYKGIEGLGFGDVKMMGWLGTWLGIEYIPFIILFASVSGLAMGLFFMWKDKQGMQTAIPFGPFLALAALLAWLIKFAQIPAGPFVMLG